MRLSTLESCGLAIGRYPRFRYDARGGGGTGTLQAAGQGTGACRLRFDPAGLHIPDLSWRTTRVLGLPLPPGVRIAIEPLELAGELDPQSGHVALHFQALFHCNLLGLYHPPALRVSTLLTSGSSSGQRHRAEGSPLGPDGRARLVGVARVPLSGDPWLDSFLGLPDDALALLDCRFTAG